MRMLVATDGSPHALKAAEMAARLARDLREAEAMLVNVGYFPAIAMGTVGLDAVFDLGDLEEGMQTGRPGHPGPDDACIRGTRHSG